MTTHASVAQSPKEGTRLQPDTPSLPRGLLRNAVYFFIFFSIAFTGGYQTLNRFNPRPSFFDSRSYYAMVQGDYDHAQLPFRYRMLVPALARCVYRVIPPRAIGSWDTVFLSILLVNAVLTALTCLVLIQLAKVATGNMRVGVTAAFLFASSWTTVNETLSIGAIDTAPCLIMTSLMWATTSSTWWLVPPLMILGGMAKETVVPLGVTFVGAWLLYTWWKERKLPRSSLLCSCVGAVAGTVTLRAVWHFLGGEIYDGHSFHWERIVAMPGNMRLWFAHVVFIGWAPFLATGLIGLNRLPHALLAGGAGAIFLALLFGSYEAISYNIGRLVFNHVGPIFALSSALFLEELLPRPAASGV